jgi:hypothetical protein
MALKKIDWNEVQKFFTCDIETFNKFKEEFLVKIENDIKHEEDIYYKKNKIMKLNQKDYLTELKNEEKINNAFLENMLYFNKNKVNNKFSKSFTLEKEFLIRNSQNNIYYKDHLWRLFKKYNSFIFDFDSISNVQILSPDQSIITQLKELLPQTKNKKYYLICGAELYRKFDEIINIYVSKENKHWPYKIINVDSNIIHVFENLFVKNSILFEEKAILYNSTPFKLEFKETFDTIPIVKVTFSKKYYIKSDENKYVVILKFKE